MPPNELLVRLPSVKEMPLGLASSPSSGSASVAKVDMGDASSPKHSRNHVAFLSEEAGPSEDDTTSATAGSLKPRKTGRSISSFFRNLFKSGDGTGPDGEEKAVDSSAKSFGTTVGQGKKGNVPTSRVLKSAFSFNAGAHAHAAPSPESPKVQPSSPSISAANHSPTRLAAGSSKSTMLAVSQNLPPKMARATWCLKDYAIVEKMYTGYASTVYKAWCKLSGETVCLKAYNMANLCELNRHQIYREIKLHGSLQHENIIALFAAFQEGDQVVLVQEFAESGDLFLLLHRYGGKLPERTSVEMVLYPFLLVLNYLHQNCVVHRDIKPENVLFTRSMVLKLCDFGLAIDLREERAVTRAGTLEYMAPEVLNCPFKNKPEENKDKQALYYSLTVDTWAVGVLTYELLVGFPPFNDKQRSAIEDKIREETPRFPSAMSEIARNFILRTLQKDALERPTIQELLAHPWIKAHRRNNSMRQLDTNRRALNRSQSTAMNRPAPAMQPADDEEAADNEEQALALASMQTMTTQRQANGELVGRNLQSFQSFTANPKPKPVAPAVKSTAGLNAGAGSGSFSTAVNPKLTMLRAGLGG